MSASLLDLLKSDQRGLPFKMTSEALAAFQALVKAFIIALMLQHFNPNKLIRVEIDTSRFTIEGAMSQLADDDGDPSKRYYKSVAFFS
jgi:hypothetical protein